jgi:hypothetical protein
MNSGLIGGSNHFCPFPVVKARLAASFVDEDSCLLGGGGGRGGVASLLATPTALESDMSVAVESATDASDISMSLSAFSCSIDRSSIGFVGSELVGTVPAAAKA